jgi:alanine racemase
MLPSWKEVFPDRLGHNVQLLKQGLPAQVRVIHVVKSDAYGHGLTTAVREATRHGAEWFAVAHLHEAVEVRAAAPDAHILLLGAARPLDVPHLAAHRIVCSLFSVEHAQALSDHAGREHTRLECHVKVDTGMGRLGLMAEGCGQWADPLIAAGRHLDVTGVYSHFAMVEPHRIDVAERQAGLFTEAAATLERIAGIRLMKHLGSTRALQLKPEWDFDAVRPGILLYGYGCSEVDARFRTLPWLEWKTRLLQIKRLPSDCPVGYYGTYRTRHAGWIGIIEVGYADGLHRALSSRGYVLVAGQRHPVIGRISMNWTAIDLGSKTDAAEGDEVVLVGTQKGQHLWADEVARWARTIPYEILTAARSPFITLA